MEVSPVALFMGFLVTWVSVVLPRNVYGLPMDEWVVGFLWFLGLSVVAGSYRHVGLACFCARVCLTVVEACIGGVLR